MASIGRDERQGFAMLKHRSRHGATHCRAASGARRQASKEGTTVNKFALAAALALALVGTAHATAIDLVVDTQTAGAYRPAYPPAPAYSETAFLGVAMSELPEPEVFAMMLVGLVLIGYRARRDSSDTFK
jgi:hypothetical protein